MIFDVDGVLTDGRLWYGADGARSSLPFARRPRREDARRSGVRCAISRAQVSAVASARRELGIEHVLQGIADKREDFRAC
jgi:3-deoxy-D-manno-octulosonate 8-phosphate phosphatase (KDO 8-P phosphatase)